MADVQGCQSGQYLNRTSPGADRTLTWDFSIASDPERCLQVQVGQSVTWDGVSDNHPLGGSGGDQPNPIGLHVNGVVTFNSVGTFGFVCLNHSSMKGAINVVAAPATPVAAGPGVSPALTLALTLLLLVTGFWMLRSRAHTPAKLLQTRR